MKIVTSLKKNLSTLHNQEEEVSTRAVRCERNFLLAARKPIRSHRSPSEESKIEKLDGKSERKKKTTHAHKLKIKIN